MDKNQVNGVNGVSNGQKSGYLFSATCYWQPEAIDIRAAMLKHKGALQACNTPEE